MAVRNWADGELLTSAALNEITSSMTMRFANAAARDSMLTGDLAPAVGMTVHLADSGMTFMYIVVGGTGYWAPLPETLCFYGRQAAAQALAGGQYSVITNFTLADHGNRNLYGWFDAAAGRFTPKIPGVYEFFGGVSMATATAGGAGYTNRCGMRLNGSPIAASENWVNVTSGSYAPVSFNARKYTYIMNGTADYMELDASTGSATNTVVTSGMAPTFGAKYLGQ